MKYRTEKVIDVDEWDKVVVETYGRPYSFQQQDGCKERGIFYLKVPDSADDYDNETIPEIVNGPEMGVSFEAWLKRDPETPLSVDPDLPKAIDYGWRLGLWWHRNFYPDVQMVANDLNKRGLLEAGDYIINIDW